MDKKQDNIIMNLLKVTEIKHNIASTNKGDLTLLLRKGETKYRFLLDTVPVEEEISDQLFDIIYQTKNK